MKNKFKYSNLNIMIKASLRSCKFLSVLYCIIVILSTTIVLILVSVLIPLGRNIDTKINKHITNREIVLSFSENYPYDIQSAVNLAKEYEHIVDVYQIPSKLSTTEVSGVLFGEYSLSCLHKCFTPDIIYGRCFSEDEYDVALVPGRIEDYNGEQGRINVISGKNLVGKTLYFEDEKAVIHKLNIVGTYDATDPIFGKDEILVPRKELLNYGKSKPDMSKSAKTLSTKDTSYIAIVDSEKETEILTEKLQHITTAYIQTRVIDAEAYKTAFIIILSSAVFFIFFVAIGLYMFLKSNVNSRIKELALYRALGYKSKNIYYIIFVEYLILGIASILPGTAIAVSVNILFINPYINKVIGNTFMAMTANISVLEFIFVLIGYVLLIFLVCRSAVKQSENTDLTVLLRKG